MKRNKAQINLKDGRVLTLVFSDMDEEIDLDDLLQIDMMNLTAELVTFPVVLNYFGIMLAQAKDLVAEREIDLRVWQAKRREEARSELLANREKSTEGKLEDMVRTDPKYVAYKKKLFSAQKNMEYLTSLFWSLKAKDAKLDKLSMTIQDGDVVEQLIESKLRRINGVTIKISEPLIK